MDQLSLLRFSIAKFHTKNYVEDEIKNRDTTTKLWLNDMGIGSVGAYQVADFLKGNLQIRELHLGGNQIGDRGMVTIAEAMPTSVERINLFGNLIGHKGAVAL